MSMRFLTYSFGEAWASMRRGVRSVLVSVLTIAAAFVVLGAFVLLWTNLRELASLWSSAAEMSVYLKDDASAQDRAAIEQVLNDRSVVAGRDYLSKDDALARFKQEFPDLAALAASASENPFPASYEARVRSGPGLTERMSALAARLGTARGVADVRYDRRWLERLQAAVGAVQWVGVVFGAVLVLGALLTVANVVRLAFHARRQEIEIMELVGAPLAYVRGPFVLEGVLQGALGAALALAILWSGYVFLRAEYGNTIAEMVGLSTIRFLPAELSGSLLLGGMVVGCAGGFIAARFARRRAITIESDAAGV